MKWALHRGASRHARARPDRSVHAREPPVAPKKRATLSGARPNEGAPPKPRPPPCSGSSATGGAHEGGAHGRKVALPPCRAAPLGCSATTPGACFIDPYQNGPTNAGYSALLPRLFCPQEYGDWAKLKVPKLEPQIEVSVGTSSHELAKHLDFTVRRSCAHIHPLIKPHFEPFTSCLFLPRRSALPNSLLTARESHVLHLLARAGMAVNTHGVHLEQAELLLGATAALAVRFRSAGAGRLQKPLGANRLAHRENKAGIKTRGAAKI